MLDALLRIDVEFVRPGRLCEGFEESRFSKLLLILRKIHSIEFETAQVARVWLERDDMFGKCSGAFVILRKLAGLDW